jgi:hypothetical protein
VHEGYTDVYQRVRDESGREEKPMLTYKSDRLETALGWLFFLLAGAALIVLCLNLIVRSSETRRFAGQSSTPASVSPAGKGAPASVSSAGKGAPASVSSAGKGAPASVSSAAAPPRLETTSTRFVVQGDPTQPITERMIRFTIEARLTDEQKQLYYQLIYDASEQFNIVWDHAFANGNFDILSDFAVTEGIETEAILREALDADQYWLMEIMAAEPLGLLNDPPIVGPAP